MKIVHSDWLVSLCSSVEHVNSVKVDSKFVRSIFNQKSAQIDIAFERTKVKCRESLFRCLCIDK